MAWIEVIWRNWYRDGGSSNPDDETLAARAYQHWRHAEILLDGVSSEFHRTDIITTLKRAIDHRLRTLRSTYKFNRMIQTSGERKLKEFELLERLNVVRPFMLHRLIRIRNAVEHQDVAPPEVSECRELVELVWYFLRSTDILVCAPMNDIDLVLPDETHVNDPISYGTYGISIAYQFEDWLPRVSGNFPKSSVSLTEKDGWAEIAVNRYVEREDLVFFTGVIRGPVDPLWAMWRDYFAWTTYGPSAAMHEQG
ncbi:hypothetical protein [Amycolatopsis orientalis]|uniref:hypothetical protein n=1 Tax=Amycolatopsis orientalis TaxID=31958 RepID=UPI0012684EF7|nr:hypothetical protein [Amycolatopsis orientalis]